MKTFELLIEKTDPGEVGRTCLGPYYYLYSILIDGKNVGGGTNYSLSQVKDNLGEYITSQVDKMPILPKDETTKWIEEGMWNLEYTQVDHKDYLYYCFKCDEMVTVRKCKNCHSDCAHCELCSEIVNIGPVTEVISKNPKRRRKDEKDNI